MLGNGEFSILSDELIKLANEDQTLLEKLATSGELADYKDEVHPELKIVFERNTKRAKEIIAKHGWPSLSQVGEEGSTAIYLIVQHSVLDEDFMQSCLPLLEESVKKGDAHGWQLAFLQDRALMQQGKPQIYGTQHIVNEDGNMEPYTILNPKTVDERRLALGLEILEEKTKFLQANHQKTLKANKRRK